MKSQEQIIGYVLLGAVVLGVALAVYNYVVPMVQKSYARNVLVSAESKLSDFASKISSTAFDYGVSTYTLDIKNSYIEINNNLVQIKIKVPIQYYSSVTRVPINYDEVIYCPNNTFALPYSGRICSQNSYINITTNSTSFTIIDEIANKTITLPLANLTNIITSRYVFDVIYNGTHLRFLPRYPTGIYTVSPPCIVSAVQFGGEVFYELTCRPVVNLENGICYWIRIVPQGVTGTQVSSRVPIAISYDRYIDKFYNSTVCNKTREIYVDLSISS